MDSDIIKVMVISNEAIKTEWAIRGNEVEEVERYIHITEIFGAERKYRENLKWNVIKLSS